MRNLDQSLYVLYIVRVGCPSASRQWTSLVCLHVPRAVLLVL